MSDCLLGSQASMWQVLGMVLGAAFASSGFTWLLSVPMWGLMWTSWPASCTVLWSMGDRLGHRAY
jgi:hypothetical protein